MDEIGGVMPEDMPVPDSIKDAGAAWRRTVTSCQRSDYAAQKRKLTPAEQRKRFIETARELGIHETEAAQ